MGHDLVCCGIGIGIDPTGSDRILEANFGGTANLASALSSPENTDRRLCSDGTQDSQIEVSNNRANMQRQWNSHDSFIVKTRDQRLMLVSQVCSLSTDEKRRQRCFRENKK